MTAELPEPVRKPRCSLAAGREDTGEVLEQLVAVKRWMRVDVVVGEEEPEGGEEGGGGGDGVQYQLLRHTIRTEPGAKKKSFK